MSLFVRLLAQFMIVVFYFSPHLLQQKLNRIDRNKVGRPYERGLSQLFVVLSAVQFIQGWLSQPPEPHLFLKQLKFHNNISPFFVICCQSSYSFHIEHISTGRNADVIPCNTLL